MRFVTILALLAFPIAEIWILINLAHHYGWWVLLYLVVIGWLGLQLIRDEKSFFSGRMMQSLSQGGNPIKAMMGSARNMVAGILLIIPGVLTDLMAVVLLLIPIKQEKFTSASMDSQASPEEPNQDYVYHEPAFKHHRQASNDEVIEGEFTEIKEETEKK